MCLSLNVFKGGYFLLRSKLKCSDIWLFKKKNDGKVTPWTLHSSEKQEWNQPRFSAKHSTSNSFTTEVGQLTRRAKWGLQLACSCNAFPSDSVCGIRGPGDPQALDVQLPLCPIQCTRVLDTLPWRTSSNASISSATSAFFFSQVGLKELELEMHLGCQPGPW